MAEEYEVVADIDCTGLAETDAAYQAPNTHTLLPNKALLPGPQPQRLSDTSRECVQDLASEGLVDPEMELLVGGSCTKITTEQAERCSSAKETTEMTPGIMFLYKLLCLIVSWNSNRNNILK